MENPNAPAPDECPMCRLTLKAPNPECMNKANHVTAEQMEAAARIGTLEKVRKKLSAVKSLNGARQAVKRMLDDARKTAGSR